MGRIYNVAELVAYAEADWVRRIGEIVGWQGDVLAVATELLPESARLKYEYDFSQDYTVDSSRIRRELGYTETVSESDALQRTIEWERLNPPELDLRPPDYQAEDATLATLRRGRV